MNMILSKISTKPLPIKFMGNMLTSLKGCPIWEFPFDSLDDNATDIMQSMITAKRKQTKKMEVVSEDIL